MTTPEGGGTAIGEAVEPDHQRTRRLRLIRTAAALIVPVAAPGLTANGSVAAFPRLDGVCHTGVTHLAWKFSGTWSTAQQSAVRNGLDDWDGFKNQQGVVFIDSTETPTGISVLPILFGVSSTTCSGGLPTLMTISLSSTDLVRTARHEAGHAHGLSHSGNDDSFAATGSRQQPQMDGCFAAPGGITHDDRAQYAHERDNSFVADAGYENSLQFHSGNFSRIQTAPAEGNWHASVPEGSAVYSNVTRVATPPATIVAGTQYKGGGTNRFKFEWRIVNYASGSCNSNGQFNPNSFNWDNPTLGAWNLLENRVLPPSPTAYADSYLGVPNPNGTGSGFALYEGVDLKLQVFSETGGNVYVDNLEAR